MATRYDQKTKDDVVAYVKKYNEEKGRGGQSAALKKWDLNPITIKSWLEKAGVETPGKGGKKKRKAGRPAKVAKSTKAAKSTLVAKAEKPARGSKTSAEGVAGTLQRLVAIQSEIASLEREFAKLKDKL